MRGYRRGFAPWRRPEAAAPGARERPIKLEWQGDGLIGRLYIAGLLWAYVEWSEKRQTWCIEDGQGRCLTHAADRRGEAPTKEDAIALATAMIRDGRMPEPQQAWDHRLSEVERKAEQRAKTPSDQRRRAERAEDKRLLHAMFDAEWRDREAGTLWEAFDAVHDFTDPELWRSNSWASLRPRLIVHFEAVVAEFRSELRERHRHLKPRLPVHPAVAKAIAETERRLERAGKILAVLHSLEQQPAAAE